VSPKKRNPSLDLTVAPSDVLADELALSRIKPVRVAPVEPHMEVVKRLAAGPEIGHGGTGVICCAYDLNLVRRVAKKELLEAYAGMSEQRGKLIEEAQITSQLDHPNIVPVHELGVDDKGNLFFTMKLVRGRTLAEILEEESPEHRTKEELFNHLQVFLKVCDALAFAHNRSVIHRDLKPGNIMVGDFGEVYLMDWGLAKLLDTDRPSLLDTQMPVDDRVYYESMKEQGFLRGTIYYMAPEQAWGDWDAIDERTDIFLLGGVLYKILTGSSPYYGEGLNHLIRKAQEATIASPKLLVDYDLPKRLCDIAMRALQKDPEDRYQSVNQLKKDVERFLQFGWQFKRRVFNPGDIIVKEGDEGDTAYIITKGRCTVFKAGENGRETLTELRNGDVFGEVAVFTNVRRTASVEAVNHVTAMEISRGDLEQDLGMSDWLGKFIGALAERYKEKDTRVAELEAMLKKGMS
jgi:tRNA A-37 threonylcarbamoyl transferase component Bud32